MVGDNYQLKSIRHLLGCVEWEPIHEGLTLNLITVKSHFMHRILEHSRPPFPSPPTETLTHFFPECERERG